MTQLAFREAGPQDGAPVLLVHGYPETSYMWRHLLPALGEAGFRALAPDLAGYGDSDPDPPGTWERHVESLERFPEERGVERVVLVVHDWGGLIGLRWACEHPDAVRALVISDTGFFADGKWHGMAEAMRAEGTGEELMDNFDRDLFAALLKQTSTGIDDAGIDEYWSKNFADEVRRRGHLELYRSGDFEKIARYDGCLEGMDVPVLIVWGGKDEFAPPAGAHRFAKHLPSAEVVVIEEAGHFVWEDAAEEANGLTLDFLERLSA